MSENGPSSIPAEVATMPPGPDLLAALTRLDTTALSAHDLVTVTKAWERQQAHAAAQQADAMAALAARREYQQCDIPDDAADAHRHDPLAPAADEVSLALACTPFQARARVATSLDLAGVHHKTLSALRIGAIDYHKAKLICERTRVLDGDDQRQWVEERVLPHARKATSRQLDQRLRRAVIAADPAAAERRRATAKRHRRITKPEPAADGGTDGMAFMSLHGPAEDLLALYTAIDAAARHARTNGDERTLEQLRFDTLTGLGWTGLDLGHLGCCNPACATTGTEARPFGHAHGRAATVGVTVSAHTLFHTHNDGHPDADHGEPAELHGYGPITADAARRVATEATLRRLLTDDVDGHLLEYGRTTYTPPRELADFVIARDVTCRFPTCHHDARHADIDHKHPWDHGGTTGATNTWTLDRGHHLGKTHHGYTIHTDQAGTTWWTTPAGHHYPVDPQIVGLVPQPPPPEPYEDPDPPPF